MTKEEAAICIHKDCKHSWKTKSKAKKITCPSCGRKTPNGK